MKATEHWLAPEELMAYLDGELAPGRSAVVRDHVSQCEACQRLAGDLSAVSTGLAAWNVEETPVTLQPPAQSAAALPRQGWLGQLAWRSPSMAFQFAGAATVVVLVGLAYMQPRSLARPKYVKARAAAEDANARMPPVGTFGTAQKDRSVISGRLDSSERKSGAATLEQPAQPPETANGPLIARTATLTIVAADFEAVRPALDRILQTVGGFVGRIDVSGSRGTPRSLSASLRVPSDRLALALEALKKVGTVTAESQSGDDVTEQAIDLDARLANARNTEKRLMDILEHRTGKVADVLEAEREIARVRGEIEQMDAQRKNLARRVSYATVTLTVEEERKAELDLGLLPLSARLRNAMVDGFRTAFDSALGALLFALGSGPTILLWALVLAWPARMLWSRRMS